MVVTSRQTEVEGYRNVAIEERLAFPKSHVLDTQNQLAGEGEHITIVEALEKWPYRLHNVGKVTIEIEHEGYRKIIDCDSLTSCQRDLIWPRLVDILKCTSRNPVYRSNRSRRSIHGENIEDCQSSKTDSGDEAQYPLSSSSSQRSASSTPNHSPINDDKYQSASNGRKRKKPRSTKTLVKSIPNEVEITKLLTIGNKTEVSEYLSQCLKEMQQDICKLIAKPWIKAINPNKQTHHPYAGGSGKAPPWWPPTPPDDAKGPVEGSVRHQEPDHLLKDERISLLRHIVLIITQPSRMKSVPMNVIDVARLEQLTNLTIGNKLDSEGGRFKRRAVNEFFNLAKQYERFLNGEIDASALVTVVRFPNKNEKSPLLEHTEDCKSDEVNVGHYNHAEPISSDIIPTSRSSASDGSHPQDFFSPRKTGNNASSGIAQYRHHFHAFSPHQQTAGDHLSYTHVTRNHTHVPSPLIRMSDSYQAPNGFAQSRPRRSQWLSSRTPNPSCSPNLALNRQTMQNSALQYTSFADPLHLPVNLNVAHTPYMRHPPSMQLQTNFQPQPNLGDSVQPLQQDSNGCSHEDLNQYSQHLHGFHLLHDQSYSDNDLKENQLRGNGPPRANYAFEPIVDERNHSPHISKSCLPNPNL